MHYAYGLDVFSLCASIQYVPISLGLVFNWLLSKQVYCVNQYLIRVRGPEYLTHVVHGHITQTEVSVLLKLPS